MKNDEKYPIGTEVYFTMEDYNSGDEIIYKGVVSDIFYHKLKLKDVTLNMKLYRVGDGIAMQCNAFYTLEELFQMKERLIYLQHELGKDIDKIMKETSVYRKAEQ